VSLFECHCVGVALRERNSDRLRGPFLTTEYSPISTRAESCDAKGLTRTDWPSNLVYVLTTLPCQIL
jgi:hypothetical protein